jgi:hypothetical protein
VPGLDRSIKVCGEIAAVMSALGSKLTNCTAPPDGISVPIGCGRLKVAAWMVPNGEAIRCLRKCSPTPGWRAMKAAKS